MKGSHGEGPAEAEKKAKDTRMATTRERENPKKNSVRELNATTQ
jgi:hypothetical protein